MKLNIIYASGFRMPDHLTIETVKNIGPTWGSWQTWQTCGTDNVICHDLSRARALYKRALHAVCNLYLPQKFHSQMSRPLGVKFYQGDFQEETHDIEDMISMHLVASNSDLVLLFGFDLSNSEKIQDRLEVHRMKNRFGLIRGCISSHPEVQWVLIDHPGSPDPAFESLPNLACDSLENVLKLLV